MPIEQAAIDFKTIVEWIVGVGAALGVIWGWIGKPIKKMTQEMTKFKTEVKEQVADIRETVTSLQGSVGDIQGSTDFLLGDRLAQAHVYWEKKKYCPPYDKARLIEMHKVYTARGLNHLYASYEEDLLDLPDEPPVETPTTK